MLSDQLASQIAAGEVVERPFSVVKELVENSIDAGATAINVDIRGGGRELIQVADNGSGIPAGEVEVAFLRHATSKLQSASDLESIATLGFRGEALAAIAAVSQITVVSRAAGEAAGSRIVLDGGRLVDRQSAGAPAGTVISVENLFHNIPARLKFLKTPATEKRHIDEFITRFALAYPAVRFRLTHDGRLTFQTAGSGDRADVLAAVYGPETVRQLLPVAGDDPDEHRSEFAVSGYASEPGLTYANRNHIDLFVNGRYIRDNRLTYAVVQAYHTLIPNGRYPLALVFIQTPLEQVDVNVHPTKVEVRFRDEGAVFSAVQRAVRQAVVGAAPVRDLGAWSPPESMATWAGERPRPVIAGRGDQPQPGPFWQPDEALLDRDQTGATARQATAEAELQLPIMRVIGQVGAAYIVAEGPDGLYLIDQHAAHERVLFEQFMAQRRADKVVSQGLIAGAAVHLTPTQATLLDEHLGLLGGLGFEIEPFGPNTVVVRAVPAILTKTDPSQALQRVLADLENEDSPLQEELEAVVVRRVCKAAAIKAGQTLSRTEMESLIAQLEACDVPHTCPHGRPTLIHLSAQLLARQFGRS